LSELSTLGHFFKGSSAAFGLEKVKASCEKIQHYGLKRDEVAGKDLKPEEALDKIKNQLAQLREEYAEAKQTLEDWFRDHEGEHEDED
jgi:osomolarity two-component system phosphorelay intermediate protein YPD1